MSNPDVLTIDEALARLPHFSDILDARSPAEFALDHLPGAISAPVLNDQERATVGTLYKQQSGFHAKRVGAVLVARNIANLIEHSFADRPRDWSPLIYCWRGGNRSGALATVLSRVGWRVSLLEGGYKAFRNRVISELETLPQPLRLIVIAGRTGSAKSLLLQSLSRQGAQVLDLEALACHRGSVLGRMPDETQPGQRRFETLLWNALRGFDARRPVYVESESRRIGTCHLPEALMQTIRSSPCIVLHASVESRAQLLLAEYRHFLADPGRLDEQLQRLIELHGRETIAEWRALLAGGQWGELVSRLLVEHYDPAYDRSMSRNFSRLGEAPIVELNPSDPNERDAIARSLLAGSAQA